MLLENRTDAGILVVWLWLSNRFEIFVSPEDQESGDEPPIRVVDGLWLFRWLAIPLLGRRWRVAPVGPAKRCRG